jgi:hypothetical protein
MTTLRPAPVPTTQLDYNPTARTYYGDISSTHGLGRVYDDACDEGLTLVSATTGREIVFAVAQIDRDSEGDITVWYLTPATPGAPDIAVVLFND